jgi:hypothetical protein
MRHVIAAAAVLVLAVPAARAEGALETAPVVPAVTVDGRAVFPGQLEHGGTRFSLSGAGLFRWKWVVKVYAASFYFGEGVEPDPTSDVPRRLEIEYFVGLDGPDFGKAAQKLLADGFPPEVLAPLQERMERLHRAYVDVKPGDRYALTYLPDRGLELALNGRPLALVEGADFARVYFAIWTGRKPIDTGLRDALLAGNVTRPASG